MKNISLLILGLILFQICNSQLANKIDWAADLDFIAKELPEKHYNLFSLKTEKEYQQALDNIKAQSSALSNFEIALKLQQLIASCGDSHTSVSFGQKINKNQILPLHLYWFSDGLYVLKTTKENSEILGMQIISVNDIPLKTIVDSLSTLITVDNQAMVKNSIPKLFPILQLHNYFGFVEGQDIKLELKDLNGDSFDYTIQPETLNRQNQIVFSPVEIPFCYKNEKAFFVENYQPEEKLYYLQYNRCWSKELENKYRNGANASKLPSFKDFEDRLFQTLKTESIDKIVFDMRFNSGGNSNQGTEFIEKLSEFTNKSEIEIFVVIGRATFSSAILNSMDFKRLTDAKFVGEETGGKPNHFGEVKNFKLPNSGLRINYSIKYFKRTDENVNTIVPDIKIESSFSDFKNGIDPVAEWIKNQ